MPERAGILLTRRVGAMGPEGKPAVDAEPAGFGDAVQAAALMLALMTTLAWIGFQWQRQHERVAQGFAEDLMERVSHRGEAALMPVWSGLGVGPTSAPTRETVRALRSLGTFEPNPPGQCRVHSRFSLCRGTRYHCEISGSTPRGPVRARIGLCSPGGRAPYTLDTFDLTLPPGDGDRGNPAELDIGRHGVARFGSISTVPDLPPPSRRLRPDTL